MADNTNNTSAAAAAAAAATAAFHVLQTSPHQVPGATTTTPSTDGARGPYRGKCLYKTGKCPNERALKTSGAAHNLCDEHRRRQNEHQRKLDSKNRFSRKDKRGNSSSSARAYRSDDAHASTDAPSTTDAARGYERTSVKHAATDPAAAAEATAVAAKGTASDTLAHLAAANGSLHALAPSHVAPAPTAAAPPSQLPMSSGTDASTKAYASSGVQPLQMTAYPYMVPDFDGIMVPLPSCFEGHERVEVRARVYQKVLDYISEECIRLYRGKAMSDGGFGAAPAAPTTSHLQLSRANGGAAVSDGGTAAAPAGVYFAPHQIVQQHQMMPSERGEKRGADTDTSSDGDGAAERDQRTLKKPQRATARTSRDRSVKHPRSEM